MYIACSGRKITQLLNATIRVEGINFAEIVQNKDKRNDEEEVIDCLGYTSQKKCETLETKCEITSSDTCTSDHTEKLNIQKQDDEGCASASEYRRNSPTNVEVLSESSENVSEEDDVEFEFEVTKHLPLKKRKRKKT